MLKGKSAAMLIKQFPELRKRYWGMHLWAMGYFVSATVTVTEAVPLRTTVDGQLPMAIAGGVESILTAWFSLALLPVPSLHAAVMVCPLPSVFTEEADKMETLEDILEESGYRKDPSGVILRSEWLLILQ